MNPQTAILSRSRQTLLLLGALFFAPFIGAWLVYNFFPEWTPTARTNYGTLISPARPLPRLLLKDAEGRPVETLLREKWSLIYLGGEACDAACRERIVLVRQVRLALGKDLARLQRIYVAPDITAQAEAATVLAKDHPGLAIVADGGENGERASDFFAPGDPLALYLVDPNGNWLLVYAGKVDPKRLLGDLKKLLRLSSIG